MLFNDHNQAKAIASLICPLLRANSPQTPFRCIAETNDTLFDDAFRLLQVFGVRKRFFQSKRDFVINSILFSEHCFEIAHQLIALRCVSPSMGDWTGSGEFKECSATDALALDGMFAALGMSPIGPSAIVEIDITGIWNQIYPLLEKIDPVEPKAEKERQQQARLESIPEYKGPPADPETAAKTEALLAQILGQGKVIPASDNNQALRRHEEAKAYNDKTPAIDSQSADAWKVKGDSLVALAGRRRQLPATTKHWSLSRSLPMSGSRKVES